jgi:hypothetical protein
MSRVARCVASFFFLCFLFVGTAYAASKAFVANDYGAKRIRGEYHTAGRGNSAIHSHCRGRLPSLQ